MCNELHDVSENSRLRIDHRHAVTHGQPLAREELCRAFSVVKEVGVPGVFHAEEKSPVVPTHNELADCDVLALVVPVNGQECVVVIQNETELINFFSDVEAETFEGTRLLAELDSFACLLMSIGLRTEGEFGFPFRSTERDQRKEEKKKKHKDKFNTKSIFIQRTDIIIHDSEAINVDQ